MIDFSKFDSLFALTMTFNTEESCIEAIVASRWGIGNDQDIICPIDGIAGHFNNE